MRLAFFAAIAGVAARFLATNRDRILELVRPRPAVDQPGSPPVPTGRYAPDVDFVDSPQDTLTEIRGVGPKSEEQLKAAGITTFEKLADLTGEQVRQVLEAPPPGADTDSWVEQARELAEQRRRAPDGA